jgi:hypothetical protein
VPGARPAHHDQRPVLGRPLAPLAPLPATTRRCTATAPRRAHRLGRDLERWPALQADIAQLQAQIATLLAATPGQLLKLLTTLPGVAAVRAAACAAPSRPVARFPTPEHLDAATGLAPATWQSATLHRRGRIPRQGLPEHRDALRCAAMRCDALMRIAWGRSQHCTAFGDRDRERGERGERGMHPIQARVALARHARHACRLASTLLKPQQPFQPFDETRYRQARHSRGR